MGDTSPGPESSSVSAASHDYDDDEVDYSLDNALLADDPLEEGNGKSS